MFTPPTVSIHTTFLYSQVPLILIKYFNTERSLWPAPKFAVISEDIDDPDSDDKDQARCCGGCMLCIFTKSWMLCICTSCMRYMSYMSCLRYAMQCALYALYALLQRGHRCP